MMGINRSTMAKARWGLTLSGLLLSSAAWAQARIEAVTGALQSGSEVVRVEMSEPLAADPTGFVVQSPARIALDFPGVSNGSGKSLLEFNQGNLRSANLVEASGRSRLVLNLKTATTYRCSARANLC
jgi:type IV pilus assembly protein PilQ